MSAANKATLAAKRYTKRFKPPIQTPESSSFEEQEQKDDSSCGLLPSDYDEEDFEMDYKPMKSFSEEFSGKKPMPLDSSFQDDDDDAYFDEMESENPLPFI